MHQILSMPFSGVNQREQDPTLESVILLVLPGFEFEQSQGSFQKSSVKGKTCYSKLRFLVISVGLEDNNQGSDCSCSCNLGTLNPWKTALQLQERAGTAFAFEIHVLTLSGYLCQQVALIFSV